MREQDALGGDDDAAIAAVLQPAGVSQILCAAAAPLVRNAAIAATPTRRSSASGEDFGVMAAIGRASPARREHAATPGCALPSLGGCQRPGRGVGVHRQHRAQGRAWFRDTASRLPGGCRDPVGTTVGHLPICWWPAGRPRGSGYGPRQEGISNGNGTIGPYSDLRKAKKTARFIWPASRTLSSAGPRSSAIQSNAAARSSRPGKRRKAPSASPPAGAVQ